jgi:23S rRNA (uridine2552-2'-O)-methyltransferase
MSYNPRDRYFRKAKQEGYRSRAAYKLIELQQRYRLMRPGDKVVDLGAAPGGWLQVAATLVGQRGKIVGVDVQQIEPFRENQIFLIHGDATSAEAQQAIRQAMNGLADVVLSDMAPKLSGIRETDMARAAELQHRALEIATAILRPGGTLVIKGFMSNEVGEMTKALRSVFDKVQRTKPDATRQGSSEFYFIATSFRGNPQT